MKVLPASITVFILVFTFMSLSLTKPRTNVSPNTTTTNRDPKIQVAILLDVSGSMSGLIDQAKTQLWNMVNVMGKVKCEGGPPKIEIALYIYGQISPGTKGDFIKQVSVFSSDLDELSKELFNLSTSGSSEYCGQVIYTSLNELNWDVSSSNYKVIFIAGNEDFLQGNLHYLKACEEVNRKGVIVNTIYCGDSLQGIQEHWNLRGECGNGSYTYINHNAKTEEIATPYDSTLFVLNYELNSTYIAYGGRSGKKGEEKRATQATVDRLIYSEGREVAAKRATAKSNPLLYRNSGWDLVDASTTDSSFIAKVDMNTLPDSLKIKSRAEVQQIINAKRDERGLIQKEIRDINAQREIYITAEKNKAAANNNTPTLESEIEKIIKMQVKRFNMVIE